MKANPQYPETLKNKALEASWVLMKQVPYVEKVTPTETEAKPKAKTQTKAATTKKTSTKKSTTKKK